MCHILQKYLVLSSHANSFYDFYFCIEPLVSLRSGQHILSEFVEAKFLVVHRYESILVLRLPQDSIFNELIQGQWIVGSANRVPFCVLLHFILLQLCSLYKNQ